MKLLKYMVDIAVSEKTSLTPLDRKMQDVKNTGGGYLLSRIEDGLNSLSHTENTGQPRANFHILLAPHGRPEDIKALEIPLESADVYIPEAASADHETLECFKKVSEGAMTPEQALERYTGFDPTSQEYAVRLAELGMLFGKKKAIAIIDASLFDFETMEDINLPYRFTLAKMNGDFPKMIQALRESLLADAAHMSVREKYMLSKLQPAVQRAIEENPSLKDKSSVDVLIRLGSGHTQFFQELAKAGQNVTREFSERPDHIYHQRDQAIRTYMAGKEPSDDLIAHVLLQRAVNSIWQPKSQEVETYFRHLVNEFTTDEIKDLLGNGKQFAKDWFKPAFLSKTEEKGIHFPPSSQEVREFNESRKPRETPVKSSK